jgi:serine/threonine protein kinase, bacterial
MPLASGTNFAGYTILRLLGSGGMGEVYLAQHPRLPRRDALKILGNDISANDEYRQRFIKEADLAAELWHPNIVRANDRGEFNEQLWISMDFVDGTDAASLLRDRYPAGMPADEVAAIIAAVAGALDYAHHHSLLHRDVKPANIFLANPEVGEQRILLGDFGIARNIGEISGLTATGMTIGTLPYAAPEQLTDEPIDGRADQYALAATAYHLLTGSTLFPHSNPAVVISRHLSTPPPALADTRTELAPLDPVLAVALAKDPADRFARCADFARAFAEAAHSGGHVTASAPTRAAPSARRPPEGTAAPPAQADADKPKRRRRHRILVAAVIAVVAITATGLVIGYTIVKNNTTSKPAPPVAVLDGTYRLDFDGAKQMENGAPAPDKSDTAWWAFRSSCASTGCAASGTKLDANNHQMAAAPPHTAAVRFVDGHWQRTFQIQEQYARCVGADGKTVAAGADTEMVAWSLEPQPDGTLKGVWSETALTTECGRQGVVRQAPVVATRTGDVPPIVTVANPATIIVTPTTSSPVPAVAGVTSVLDGAFRVDFQRANMTLNGEPATGDPPPTVWWAFRSLCTSAGCVATGTELGRENHYQPIGNGNVLRFVDGQWQDTPQLTSPAACTSGHASTNATDTWSWQPQPDGTLRGNLTLTALTNECGDQGSVIRVPMIVTRVGDVPPTAILADPALFLAPAAPPTTGAHP